MKLETLRSFLKLGARAEIDGIPADEVMRQEQTVLAALNMLEQKPGLVLADEVGMGKTYEALGIAAAIREGNPRSRVVIITPGPDLNTKWSKDITSFRAMYDFGDCVAVVSNLQEFVGAIRTHPIVLASVTMFRRGSGQDDQALLLAIYCHWRSHSHQTIHAIFRRVFPGGYTIPDLREARFLDAFDRAALEPHLDRAFKCRPPSALRRLDDIFSEGGLDAFSDEEAVRKALTRARFELCRCLLPKIDLLIVDEAHKLKNSETLQASAIHQIFEKRFRKALLLTATPFQLEVGEMREIFKLFALATTAPTGLVQDVKNLLQDVRQYQKQYDDFQQTWLKLDPLLADEFSACYEKVGAQARFDDAGLNLVLAHVTSLRNLKDEKIEPGLRTWMIRSLRVDKRKYRRSAQERIRPKGSALLPFLLYERFLAELFRQDRPTHKTSVEINMVSSYAAATAGTLMQKDQRLPSSAEAYRALLLEILSGNLADMGGQHPKVSKVVTEAIQAARRGEKTLVFCARTETVRQLQAQLGAEWEVELLNRWRAVYPGARTQDIFDTKEDTTRHRGRHSLLQARFHRPQDALYLALREPCFPESSLAGWALERLSEIIQKANGLLASERVSKAAAERVDYAIARKCFRRAVASLRERDHPRSSVDPYLMSSSSLDGDPTEDGSEPGNAVPSWTITAPLARTIIGNGVSLWGAHAARLADFPHRSRARIVEQLAHYLTYKQVPFLAELLLYARNEQVRVDPPESIGLLNALPGFWRTTAGSDWLSQIGEFLSYLAKQTEAHQTMILDDMDKTRTGGFARHTLDAESRERLRQLFNTPLFPSVLVANSVMQEGLDLHRQCRRIVHHDLEWNPAQVEQRIGRIDRLGSLTSRLRVVNPDTTLDVLYPVIISTIDERLYRSVKMREKWLEFLLGARPQFEGFTFADEIPRALPARLASELAIKLEPHPH